MARTVTIQSIADAARVHADMRHSQFINDTEILSRINDAYCELYDELVSAYENYFVNTTTFSISSATANYPLPDDFYKVIGLDFQVNQGAFITLKPFMEAERNVMLTTNQNLPAGTVRLRYVPAPTTFQEMTDMFDGVAGWERLVALVVAIDMLDAEESDSSALTRKYARMLQRIKDMSAPRDAGMPAKVVDVYQPTWAYIYGALRYRLYGNTVEMINSEFLGADQHPFF